MNQNKFDSTDDFLAHYGVLGMKWGVRKDGRSQGYQGSKPKGVVLDKQTGAIKRQKRNEGAYSPTSPAKGMAKGVAVGSLITPAASAVIGLTMPKKAIGTNKKESPVERLRSRGVKTDGLADARKINTLGYGKVSNRFRKQMNKTVIPELNNKYSQSDLTKPGKDRDAYFKEFTKAANKSLKEETERQYGKLAAKNVTVHVDYDPLTMRGPAMYATRTLDPDKVKHSDSETVIDFIVKTNDKGFIVSVESKNEMTHSDSVYVDDFLAHYGVLGMKWGVRKDRRSGNSRSSKETSTEKPTSKSVKFKSNRRRRSAVVRSDMTLAELKKVNERLRLELELNRHLNDLAKQNQSRSQKIKAETMDIIKTTSKNTVVNIATAKLTQMGKEALKVKTKTK